MEKETLVGKIRLAGYILLFSSISIILFQYFPVIKEEIAYLFRTREQKNQEVLITKTPTGEKESNIIVPIDTDLSLIIPKIGVNTPIIEDVDPFNSEEYQKALSRGIAHAKDSSTPKDKGNTVLFAHSSDNFYNANQYNAVFYLLNKMKIGDYVYAVQDSKIYKYEVIEKSVTNPDEVSYMENSREGLITLITCWPPGTTFKRLIIVAKLI